jgi:hypothetical protein
MNWNKLGVVSLFVLACLTLVSGAGAEDFDLSVEGQTTYVTPPNETASFTVHVTNNADEEQRYRVYANGAISSSTERLSPSFLTVQPGETGRAQLNVTPGLDVLAGRWGYEFSVIPLSDGSVKKTERASFSVTHDRNIILTSFSGPEAQYRPGEEVQAEVTLRNVIQRDIPANEYRLVLQVGDRGVVEAIPSLSSGESKTVTATVGLEDMRAGTYEMEVLVKDINDTVHTRRTGNVEVQEYLDVDYAVANMGGLLWTGRKLAVRNDGNVRTQDLSVGSDLPWFAEPFVTVEGVTGAVTASENGLQWNIGELEPGQTAYLTLRTEYWGLLVVLLILFGICFGLYSQYRNVSIVKSTQRKDGRYTVHLRVKNTTGSDIEGVEVKDFVPGIASLIEKFDSKRPDKIQGTDAGTKLVWDLGAMDAGEERIITYKIKPKVQVEGPVSLPSADVNYDKRGIIKSRSSHPASADFS